MRRLALPFFSLPCYPVNMNTPSRTRPHTRLAILGTLADLHRQPLTYDLGCLRTLVAGLEPDLLCAEVTPGAWEGGDLSATAIEVREALTPVVASTDIVLVPVIPTPEQYADFIPSSGWRRSLAQALDRLLLWGQRKADRPEAINGPVFGAFCHTVCWMIERTWTANDRQAWIAQNRIISDNILQAVQRDPGRRVLVAVQCQRLHWLVRTLKAYPEELEIVRYQEL